MNTTYEYRKTVTVEEIYRLGATKPPKGFKLTGEFRPPKAGEHFLSVPNGTYDWALLDFSISSPRLILTEAPLRKQYVFTETGEEREVRKGEWYLSLADQTQPLQAFVENETCSPRKILTLEVREIQ